MDAKVFVAILSMEGKTLRTLKIRIEFQLVSKTGRLGTGKLLMKSDLIRCRRSTSRSSRLEFVIPFLKVGKVDVFDYQQ